MAEAYLNGKAGKWRTVGGRRIFIAEGETLEQAMKKSGKFKNLKEDDKPQELKPLSTYLKEHGIEYADLDSDEVSEYLKEYRRNGEIKSLERGSKEHYDTLIKSGMNKEDAQHIIDLENGKKVLKEDSYGGYHTEKTIQLKGGDKTKYKVLDEATDSMGEKIYKVMEDGQEKWVQGDLFTEKKTSTKKVSKTLEAELDRKIQDFMVAKKKYDKMYETSEYDNMRWDDPRNQQFREDRRKAFDEYRKAEVEALTTFSKTVPFEDVYEIAKVASGSKNVKFDEVKIQTKNNSVYADIVSNDIKQDAGIFGSALKSVRLESFNSNFVMGEDGDPYYWGSLDLRYQHNDGGTNGMSLLNYKYTRDKGWDITDSAGYVYRNGKKITSVNEMAQYFMDYYGYGEKAAKASARKALNEIKERQKDIDY